MLQLIAFSSVCLCSASAGPADPPSLDTTMVQSDVLAPRTAATASRTAWNDDDARRDTLAHCSNLLLSAIDAPSLVALRNGLTNYPSVVQRTFKSSRGSEIYSITNADLNRSLAELEDWANGRLNVYVQMLTNANGDAFVMDKRRYYMNVPAAIAGHDILFHFIGREGPVLQVEERDAGSKVVSTFVFHKNGKLKYVERAHQTMVFNANGHADHYFLPWPGGLAVRVQKDLNGRTKILTIQTDSP